MTPPPRYTPVLDTFSFSMFTSKVTTEVWAQAPATSRAEAKKEQNCFIAQGLSMGVSSAFSSTYTSLSSGNRRIFR